MTSPKVFMVTKEGLKNLQADLEHLQTVRRKEIAGKIREAKEFGDLSENAEYHDAKNEQALVESEILDLESKIKNSKIIDKSTKSSNVQIGSKVVLINLETIIEESKYSYFHYNVCRVLILTWYICFSIISYKYLLTYYEK